LPSAGYAYTLAFDLLYRTNRDQFLWSVLITHVWSWLFLVLASVGAPHSWQDRPAGAKKARWRERWLRWSHGSANERKAYRTRLLKVNPCLWLGGRHRLKPMSVWAILGVMGSCWFWAYLKWKDEWLNEMTYVGTAILLQVLLKLWVTSEACQKLGADRRSGALELLLSTPLTVREIVRGQMLALRRQFLAPVAVVVVIDFVFMFSGFRQVAVSEGNYWMWFCLAGISSFVADVYTLVWVGLWLGLTARHANRAAGATVLRVLVLPWLACFAVWLLITLLELWGRIDNEGYFLVGSWFVLAILNDLVFCLWARTRLLGSLRTIATQRHAAPRSWFWWRPRRRRTRTPELPPVMVH
jgi:hypothetical protein